MFIQKTRGHTKYGNMRVSYATTPTHYTQPRYRSPTTDHGTHLENPPAIPRHEHHEDPVDDAGEDAVPEVYLAALRGRSVFRAQQPEHRGGGDEAVGHEVRGIDAALDLVPLAAVQDLHVEDHEEGKGRELHDVGRPVDKDLKPRGPLDAVGDPEAYAEGAPGEAEDEEGALEGKELVPGIGGRGADAMPGLIAGGTFNGEGDKGYEESVLGRRGHGNVV